jgi:2'-5' RNA ligase
MNDADRETASRHEAIWQRFRREPRVNAWTGRLPFPPEVAATLGFVLPVDDPAVCDRLEESVKALQPTGCVIPFPRDYWHITIVPPVFLTDGEPEPPRLLPRSFADEALAVARATVADERPFPVSVRGLNAFREVVVAVPYDGGRGLALGDRLRKSVPNLPERYPDGHDPLPHVSLAQYGREDGLGELSSLVEAARDRDFGGFTVDRVEMYVLPWREGVPGPVQKHAVPLAKA